VARGDLGAELPIEDVPLLQVRLYCMYSFRRTNLSFIPVSRKELCENVTKQQHDINCDFYFFFRQRLSKHVEAWRNQSLSPQICWKA
jgi:hypothetical protein